jgi:integrase
MCLPEGLTMRIKLTPSFCASATAAAGADKTVYWDEKMQSFGLVVYRSGKKGFCIQYRHGRTSRRMAIDGVLSLDQARKRARVLLGQVAHDRDPLGERRKEEDRQRNTLRSVCEEFFKRDGKRLRSADAWRANLERAVLPRLGSMPIADIKRSDIVKLLDRLEDERGAAAAHTSLAVLRRILRWHATRNDEFNSPVVAGMGRYKPSENARERILSDTELRAVWAAATEMDGSFGSFVKFLLLTAARRNEAARMIWPEVNGTDWILPPSRNKTKQELVRPLSRAAQSVLASLPRFASSPHVFSITGRTALRNFGKPKARLDQVSGVTGWTLHDLRRTSRSLLSRAGVNADIAERCLGHVIGGVRGVYDRHSFGAEMAIAFEKLSALIEQIVHPQENVLPMVRR